MLAVEPHVDVLVLRAQFDPADVLDPHDPAVAAGLDDDVLELFDSDSRPSVLSVI